VAPRPPLLPLLAAQTLSDIKMIPLSWHFAIVVTTDAFGVSLTTTVKGHAPSYLNDNRTGAPVVARTRVPLALSAQRSTARSCREGVGHRGQRPAAAHAESEGGGGGGRRAAPVIPMCQRGALDAESVQYRPQPRHELDAVHFDPVLRARIIDEFPLSSPRLQRHACRRAACRRDGRREWPAAGPDRAASVRGQRSRKPANACRRSAYSGV
jgi:hypothetical protein